MWYALTWDFNGLSAKVSENWRPKIIDFSRRSESINRDFLASHCFILLWLLFFMLFQINPVNWVKPKIFLMHFNFSKFIVTVLNLNDNLCSSRGFKRHFKHFIIFRVLILEIEIMRISLRIQHKNATFWAIYTKT